MHGSLYAGPAHLVLVEEQKEEANCLRRREGAADMADLEAAQVEGHFLPNVLTNWAPWIRKVAQHNASSMWLRSKKCHAICIVIVLQQARP
jgi:hypothetical protein